MSNPFCDVFERCDETKSTLKKVEALRDYFSQEDKTESALGLYYLLGHREKRLFNSTQLRELCAEFTNYPLWMIDESYEAVGDLAETIALVIDTQRNRDVPEKTNLTVMHSWIQEMRSLKEQARKQKLFEIWKDLSFRELFVWNKLLTGAFRVGVSKQLIIRALSEISKVPSDELTRRLLRNLLPTSEFFERLLDPEANFDTDSARAYPFFLASPLEKHPEDLGSLEEWQIEWKWDGIRLQIICRDGQVCLWSRGDEIINDAFPDLIEQFQKLSISCVLDAELLAFDEEEKTSFSQLQKRLNRKKISKKIIDEIPVHCMAYDVLEYEGEDLREKNLSERRELLEKIHSQNPKLFHISPLLHPRTWEEAANLRAKSRELGTEGLMLKRKNSTYQVGRKRGDWFKWKIDPFNIDAVLLYAQAGHGRRATLYTDYTFAVWKDNELVPIAKAYSGLTDEEINELDSWIKRNTLERFGPVRSVPPTYVFELAFEGIAPSPRHKSGIALRFPRILRWRKDKKPEEADQLETLRKLVNR